MSSRPVARPRQALVLAGVGALLLAAPVARTDAVSTAGAGLVAALGFTCLALAIAWAIGEPARAALGLAGATETKRPGTVVAALGCLAVSDWLATAFAARAPSGATATAAEAGPLGFTLLLAGCAIAPAFAEEVLFRGAALRAIARTRPAWVAAATTSVLFGLFHLHTGVGPAIAAGGVGLYLALLVLARGGVSIAIACHAANNAYALTIAALGDVPVPSAVALVWRIVCAAGFVATAIALARGWRVRNVAP